MKLNIFTLQRIFNPKLLIVLVSFVMICSLAKTAFSAEFYVDPDFSGTGNGSPAYPWNRLDGNSTTAWSTINKTLATADVTVYFSAREAGSDTDETSSITLGVRRTDTSTHRLTLDGKSKYNTNDAIPSWTNYTGSSRYKISGAPYAMESGFSGPKKNYVTIRGFKLVAGTSKALSYWGGDHLVFEFNDFSATSSSTGSLVFFEYAHRTSATDARQNGGCTDIVFRNNVVHDTAGEGIYIGGSSDTGLPAHSNIQIKDNVIFNAGKFGGEGDCIDIKDGNSDVLVSNNLCYENIGAAANGIVSHSPAVIEHNVIYGLTRSGIDLNTYWGRGYGNTIVRDNIIFNNSLDGIALRSTASDRQILKTTIDHNTIYNNGRTGMYISSTNGGFIADLIASNNIVTNNKSAGIFVTGGLTHTISNNDFYGNTPSDYSGISNYTSIRGNISSNPSFINSSVPSGSDNIFWTIDDGLKPRSSSPVAHASDKGSFIGALPSASLQPPSNLTVVK